MNKQEKNIVDILTFEDTEDIVDIFIDKFYHTDKTVALIANKELIQYAMDVLLNDDCITVKRVDLELDCEDAEYMISVDNDMDMVVQPVEYYDDKYFKGIEYAFVDMDGCVEQMTIDKLLDREISVVLFGCEDEEDCDYDGKYGCRDCDGCNLKEDISKKDVSTTAKSTYKVNGKEVTKEEFETAVSKIEDAYLDNVRDMLLRYCDVMDSVNEWRKFFW